MREVNNQISPSIFWGFFWGLFCVCYTVTILRDTFLHYLIIFSQVVQQLPPPHFRTLEYLTRHLARVAENNASTGMTAKNVAIVWAPNLLRCKELEFGGVAALQVCETNKRLEQRTPSVGF
jgi:hypothetical protein